MDRGKSSVVFRLLNGDEHNPTGIYLEVIPEQILVFIWDLPATAEQVALVTGLAPPCETFQPYDWTCSNC